MNHGYNVQMLESISMDIAIGLPLATVKGGIPWHASLAEIQTKLGLHNTHMITENYCSSNVLNIHGLETRLGLLFENRRLCRIELLTPLELSMEESFARNQTWLEQQFGDPSESGQADAGFLFHRWNIGHVCITHTVIDRFVVSEHVILKHD
ncbi:MAG: hypothetical protein V4719_21625 [Planctomycetota bacterium]